MACLSALASPAGTYSPSAGAPAASRPSAAGPRSAVAAASRVPSERTSGPVTHSRWPSVAVTTMGFAMLIPSRIVVTPAWNDAGRSGTTTTAAVSYNDRSSSKLSFSVIWRTFAGSALPAPEAVRAQWLPATMTTRARRPSAARTSVS